MYSLTQYSKKLKKTLALLRWRSRVSSIELDSRPLMQQLDFVLLLSVLPLLLVL